MPNRSFELGLFTGLLLMFGADAIHWMITGSAHPDASTVRQILVVVQALVGFGGAVLLYQRARKQPQT